jgi:cytoskeleton protein RodZ
MTFVKKPLAGGATLGDRLRAIREDAGLSLVEVGKRLSVNPKYLTAIEESRYRDIPGLVYARQFVRRYAELLETDVPMAMDIFATEYAVVSNARPSRRPLLTQRVSTDFPWWRRHARALMAGVIVAAVLTYIGIQAAKNFLPPKLVVSDPAQNITTSLMMIVVEGTTDANASVTINDQDVQTDGQGQFRESIDLRLGLNTLRISAIKKHSAARVVTRQVLVEQPAP